MRIVLKKRYLTYCLNWYRSNLRYAKQQLKDRINFSVEYFPEIYSVLNGKYIFDIYACIAEHLIMFPDSYKLIENLKNDIVFHGRINNRTNESHKKTPIIQTC